jgi:hypothetical protein
MRSRALRLICSAAAWIALGAAGFFIVQSEKQITARGSGVRAFDLHAREAALALADVRVAQQAYVAAGQDMTFWIPKVASTIDRVTTAVGGLREAAVDATTRAALDQAANTVAMFGDIDKRAREYLKSDQQLMAADVIFTEGGEASATAARSIEAARLAERQAADAADAATRKLEAWAIGAAFGLAALVVLLLVPVRLKANPMSDAGAVKANTTYDMREVRRTMDVLDDEWASPASPVPPALPALVAESALPAEPAPPALVGEPAPPALSALPAEPAPPDPLSLQAAAALATDFGRFGTLDELTQLLGRTAEAMDATGLVVWIGSLDGHDLRPSLAHGYNEQTLARMAPVARTEDNAAAAAYRSGVLQIVPSKPGSSGAIVAPILVSGGCIGALSAEFHGGETSESVQAFAAIVAAQLATVFSTPAAESIEPKAANA